MPKTKVTQEDIERRTKQINYYQQQNREQYRKRVLKVLEELENSGERITFNEVAARAEVSTSYLQKEIDLRDKTRTLVKKRKYSNNDQFHKILTKLELIEEENKQLKLEIETLKEVLEEFIEEQCG